MLMTVASNSIDGTAISAVAALLGMIFTAGGAFFFVGRLSGRMSGLETKIDSHRAETLRELTEKMMAVQGRHDFCQIERGNVESKLFEAVQRATVKIARIEALLEHQFRDQHEEGRPS